MPESTDAPKIRMNTLGQNSVGGSPPLEFLPELSPRLEEQQVLNSGNFENLIVEAIAAASASAPPSLEVHVVEKQ